MELKRLEQLGELELVRLQQQQRQLVLRRRRRGLSMPILKLLLVAAGLVVLAVANSFVNHLAQQESLIKQDLALHRELCDVTDPSRACADQLMTDTVSTVGLLLAADQRRNENGPLSAAELESIRAEWRRRYEAQTDGRIYPALANACAEHLGERCPSVVLLSSWDYQERLHRSLDLFAETDTWSPEEHRGMNKFAVKAN